MATQQQQGVAGVSRKRSKESVSSTQSEAPTAKKKKLDKVSGRPGKRPDPASTPQTLPPTTTLEEEEGGVGSSPRPGGEEASLESQARSSAAAPLPPTAKKKPPKNWYLKPQRPSPGSWMGHMASLLVHRCAQRADACGLDPRHHLSDINWSKMVDGLLRPQDMHLIWYYIRREYPEVSVPEILDTTRPYAELSVDILHREEIRIKYKDLHPKVPLSPYMLFMKSKQPKLKQKYPNLQMTEVAAKIGKKWSALPDEKKEKYKQQYTLLKASYETKLKEFYEEHPDARPPPKQPPSSRSKKVTKSADAETEEERRLKELKAQLPKQPLSGYLHFCKKKREKLHRKYPELPPNAVTVKLGKRWQSMDMEARSKYAKLHDESVKEYKDNLARFNSEHPDAQEILAKARKKRKPRGPSAKQQTLTVGEDGKVAATASSPPLLPSLSQCSSVATSTPSGEKEEEEEEEREGGVEGEGEAEEEEDDGEEDEEAIQGGSQNHQNGEEEGSSESESADSSTEN